MPEFEVTMGGYDIKDVDRVVALVEAVRNNETISTKEDAVRALTSRKAETFPRRFRGYSKIQVRNYIEDRLRELA